MKKSPVSVVLSSFLVKNAGRLAAKLISRKKAAFILAAASIPFTGLSLHAADGTWVGTANGNWSVASNWSSNPTVPGGTGSTVGLTLDIAATRTVTIDTTSRTVGTLNIGDSNGT